MQLDADSNIYNLGTVDDFYVHIRKIINSKTCIISEEEKGKLKSLKLKKHFGN
jgi:hypothetical protein